MRKALDSLRTLVFGDIIVFEYAIEAFVNIRHHLVEPQPQRFWAQFRDRVEVVAYFVIIFDVIAYAHFVEPTFRFDRFLVRLRDLPIQLLDLPIQLRDTRVVPGDTLRIISLLALKVAQLRIDEPIAHEASHEPRCGIEHHEVKPCRLPITARSHEFVDKRFAFLLRFEYHDSTPSFSKRCCRRFRRIYSKSLECCLIFLAFGGQMNACGVASDPMVAIRGRLGSPSPSWGYVSVCSW